MRISILVILCCSLLLSCKKDKVESIPTPYLLKIPSHFPDMPIPLDNPMTVEGVALGRKLFYEKKLSGDNTMACASCHAPSSAFSDPNQFSEGIDGIVGNRNSMALINLGWNQSFFWDGRAKTLEEQIILPVIDPIEMHDTWMNVSAELQSSVEYRNMFFAAFGITEIDSIYSAKAIAQFIRTMISGNSKFDVIYKVENNLTLSSDEASLYASVTVSELAGYGLFNDLNGADCAHCHNGALMQVQGFSNNGLDAIFTDIGRGAVTNNSLDDGKFKIPTLRNIAYSAPYMHDGRFASIDDVINHYSHTIQISSTLDPLIEFSAFGGVQLDAFEKDLLKQFLMTLSDESFINNPDFKEPL